MEDTSDEEEEDMALKVDGKSLKKLMKGRNKVSTPKEANKSKPSANVPPPHPQLLAKLRLKPIPKLKKKRPNDVLEEGEIGLQREIAVESC